MANKKQGLSRRQFMKTGAAAGAGALLAGASGQAQTARAAVSASDMPLRPFGKTGRDVSILSMGGMFDIVNNQMQLRQALRLGVTYWDTAHSYGYGRSEAGMGKYLAAHPDLRPQLFLVTKSTERGPDGWDRELAESLQKLETSYVDLFFVHGINDIERHPRLGPRLVQARQGSRQDKALRLLHPQQHGRVPQAGRGHGFHRRHDVHLQTTASCTAAR